MTMPLRELAQPTAVAVPAFAHPAVPGIRSLPPRRRASDNRSPYVQYLKRPLDLALVLIGLPLALPLILLMALLVMMDGHAPFYRQDRVGRGGKSYKIWKLRTMVPGADAKLEAHLASDPAARAEWDETQKLQKDPRITGVGRILRKTSMDELPQLLNVLAGDMSLIGPRPMMPSQRALYFSRSYYDMRPGMTGLWQVSRRNDASFAERARIDEVYARSLSFLGDIRILLTTARVVLRGTGV